MNAAVDEDLVSHGERTRAAEQLSSALKQVWFESIEVYVGKTSVRIMGRQIDRDKWLSVVAAFLKAENSGGGWTSEICERYMLAPSDTGNKLIRAWQIRVQSEDLIGALHLIGGTFLAIKGAATGKKPAPTGGVVDFTVKTPPATADDGDYAPAIRRSGYKNPKGAGGWALNERNMGPK